MMVRREARSLLAFLVCFGAFIGFGAAEAGDEKRCAKQYSLEEHVILEWAAIGGDPHAQFAIAQCAFPDGRKKLSAAEKIYAVKWVTLAACDTASPERLEQRDRITRRLKEKGDLSFRRFGGVTDDERMSRREKRFLSYRAYKTEELMRRLTRLADVADESDRARARAELADELSRLGPLGLLRLGDLSSCEHFGASPAFAAAAWAAAAEAWSDDERGAIYGESGRRKWSPATEAADRMARLTDMQRRTAMVEKSKLQRYGDAQLAALEEAAALGRLQELQSVNSLSTFAGLSGGSVNGAEAEGGTDAQQGVFSGAAAAAARLLGVSRENDASGVDAQTSLAETSFAQNGLAQAGNAQVGRVDAHLDAAGAPDGLKSGSFEGPAVAMATQYALEALGFMEFVNGPDNDYGPSTIDAVARAQQTYGKKPTRWLSHGDVREMICDAAVKAGDPVSYYHLGVMFTRGLGYPADLVRAKYAFGMADQIMGAQLAAPEELPAWKTQSYFVFRNEIDVMKREVADAWSALPAADKTRMSEWTPSAPLCR